MTATLEAPPKARFETMQDVLDVVGDVPPERVLLHPLPGTATELDVLKSLGGDRAPCELVDGILVEKPAGWKESLLAGAILSALREHVLPRQLGVVSGADGPYRLRIGLVRIPDVAYIEWARIPDAPEDTEPIPSIIPNLAVEVLSLSNTKNEIEKKLAEYFTTTVQLAWIFDPKSRTVAVHTTSGKPDRLLIETDVLDGGAVLPEFRLNLSKIFAELERPKPPKAGQPE
jgi:Uma2 family endonuclease